DRAINDMKALEQAGGSKSSLTHLYLELSRSLQKEMDAQRARHDPSLVRTQAAYRQFLAALVASQSGQSYESLMFAGESMLNLKADTREQGTSQAKEAAAVFERVLKAYEKDPAFQKAPERLLRTRIRLAEALRRSGRFEDAQALLSALLKEQP